MKSIDERVRARGAALGRLSSLTTWIGVAALAAVGVFAGIAAVTIPGKASAAQDAATSQSAATSTSNGTAYAPRHHHDTTSVSASSGPPMAVTGSSH